MDKKTQEQSLFMIDLHQEYIWCDSSLNSNLVKEADEYIEIRDPDLEETRRLELEIQELVCYRNALDLDYDTTEFRPMLGFRRTLNNYRQIIYSGPNGEYRNVSNAASIKDEKGRVLLRMRDKWPTPSVTLYLSRPLIS